jgi:hypothetical protein
MPLIIAHRTRGLFVACLEGSPSFSKRRNAAYQYFLTTEDALEELSHWPVHIAGRCSIYETNRGCSNIESLLAYIARKPYRRVLRIPPTQSG